MDSKAVIENYKHGQLLKAIKDGLAKLNLSEKAITIESLAPVDEFHIGGRMATVHLTEQLGFKKGQTVLDLGCGLGGAARYAAQKFDCKVEGLDLCQEYVETGNALNQMVKLQGKIMLKAGNALDLPYSDNFFDGAYQIHAGMNIENKEGLFSEVYRVLKPGAMFGIFDIMSMGQGEPSYPMPWASTAGISHLATPDQYESALEEAGFEIAATKNRKDFAVEFFEKIKAKAKEAGGPPPLGLHTLMQASTPAKIQNMIAGTVGNMISPVEIVAKKI